MEKHADAADTSVLYFSLDVLIFLLCTRKLDKNTKQCDAMQFAKSTAL